MTTVALGQFSSVGSLTLPAVIFFSVPPNFHFEASEYEEKVRSILVGFYDWKLGHGFMD